MFKLFLILAQSIMVTDTQQPAPRPQLARPPVTAGSPYLNLPKRPLDQAERDIADARARAARREF